jgi:hypothetical protein
MAVPLGLYYSCDAGNSRYLYIHCGFDAQIVSVLKRPVAESLGGLLACCLCHLLDSSDANLHFFWRSAPVSKSAVGKQALLAMTTVIAVLVLQIASNHHRISRL